MPQNKKRKINRLETTHKVWRIGRKPIITASVVIVIILIMVGIFYYFREEARYSRLTVITVDDTSINMDYFLRRTKLAGSDPVDMLQQLAIEQIIKLRTPDFIGEPSPSDIDTVLKRIASSESDLTEIQSKEWYSQEFKATGLSDAEYKDIILTNMLTDFFHQYLAERVPTVTEQVHLHIIELKTDEDADKAKTRIEAGKSFAAVAREVSLDIQYRENGGDAGWVPRGVTIFDSQIFSLPIDEVSDPVPYYSQTTSTSPDGYFLLMVSEKESSREVDENNLEILKSQVLHDWLSTEIPQHNISYNVDSETLAWIDLRLAKMPTPKPMQTLTSASTSTTTP